MVLVVNQNYEKNFEFSRQKCHLFHFFDNFCFAKAKIAQITLVEIIMLIFGMKIQMRHFYRVSKHFCWSRDLSIYGIYLWDIKGPLNCK